MRARAGASSAIRDLMPLALPNAVILRAGKEVEVPTAEIFVGDTVVIWPRKLPGLRRADDRAEQNISPLIADDDCTLVYRRSAFSRDWERCL
jgi:hypothetical protein